MCEMEERNRYDAEFAETINLSRMFEGRIDGCSERGYQGAAGSREASEPTYQLRASPQEVQKLMILQAPNTFTSSRF
jgi:hypothetical protein